MKKFLTVISVVLVFMCLCTMASAASGLVTMYAPDGRSISVSKGEVQSWKNVGWYDYPVTTMYAPDGRTEVVYSGAVADWKRVGWYDYPVTKVYAPDGRTAIIYSGAVEEWKRVGWSLYPNGTAVLKEYAKNIDYLYMYEFDMFYTDVRFRLEDFSGDGMPELIAVGVSDGCIEYFEVYEYNEGHVSTIFTGRCGAANGGFYYPIRYDGRAYVIAESYSSGTGFYQSVMRYAGWDWIDVYTSYIAFDYETGRNTHAVLNGVAVSDAKYDAHRNKVSNGYMQLYEFVSAWSL